MNFELFTLQGYGHFVWPAFIFTFLCFFILYLKTKKELNKQEAEIYQDNRELVIIDDSVNVDKHINIYFDCCTLPYRITNSFFYSFKSFFSISYIESFDREEF